MTTETAAAPAISAKVVEDAAKVLAHGHPAALQIALAARLREFCLSDFAPGDIFTPITPA